MFGGRSLHVMYDVWHTCEHTDDECENGDYDDHQVAQTEQTVPEVSFVLVDFIECQEADDGRECDTDGR